MGDSVTYSHKLRYNDQKVGKDKAKRNIKIQSADTAEADTVTVQHDLMQKEQTLASQSPEISSALALRMTLVPGLFYVNARFAFRRMMNNINPRNIRG